MLETKVSLSDLSSSDYQFVQDICNEFNMTLDNTSVKIVSDNVEEYPISKYTKVQSCASEVTIRVDVLSKNSKYIDFLMYLLETRKNIINSLDNTLSI